MPIIKLLKTRAYRELATFQDAVIDVLYQADSSIILHGGTAVWRCYGGSRFSNDIDVYLRSQEHLKKVKESMSSTASLYGISIEKVKDTGHLVFIGLKLSELYLKVEINYWKKISKPITARFEKVEGDYAEVRTLSPEELILEKIAAYNDRKLIRDIYDIYILADHVSEINVIKKKVLNFLKNIEEPLNADVLHKLIYSGPVPSFDNMLLHIRGKFA